MTRPTGQVIYSKGLAAELSDHLGYDKGDPAGRGSPNSRNGSTPKTVSTEVGKIDLATPRDRNVGVDTDGIKHVLGIWVQSSEGATFWLHVLTELRNRASRTC